MLKLSKSYQNNYGIHSKSNVSKYFKLSLFVFAAMFFTLSGTPTFSQESKIACKQRCKAESNPALRKSCLKECK